MAARNLYAIMAKGTANAAQPNQEVDTMVARLTHELVIPDVRKDEVLPGHDYSEGIRKLRMAEAEFIMWLKAAAVLAALLMLFFVAGWVM